MYGSSFVKWNPFFLLCVYDLSHLVCYIEGQMWKLYHWTTSTPFFYDNSKLLASSTCVALLSTSWLTHKMSHLVTWPMRWSSTYTALLNTQKKFLVLHLWKYMSGKITYLF